MDKMQAVSLLNDILKPNDVVYTIVTSFRKSARSVSGVSRTVAVLAVRDGGIVNISEPVAELLGRKMSTGKSGIVTNVVGMDCGLDIVYSLSLKLFGDGYQLKHRWL